MVFHRYSVPWLLPKNPMNIYPLLLLRWWGQRAFEPGTGGTSMAAHHRVARRGGETPDVALRSVAFFTGWTQGYFAITEHSYGTRVSSVMNYIVMIIWIILEKSHESRLRTIVHSFKDGIPGLLSPQSLGALIWIYLDHSTDRVGSLTLAIVSPRFVGYPLVN